MVQLQQSASIFISLQLLLVVFDIAAAASCKLLLPLSVAVFPIAYQSRRQLGWRISQSLGAEAKN